jgi:hypothetical protein
MHVSVRTYVCVCECMRVSSDTPSHHHTLTARIFSVTHTCVHMYTHAHHTHTPHTTHHTHTQLERLKKYKETAGLMESAVERAKEAKEQLQER